MQRVKNKRIMEANKLMIGDYFYRLDCVDRVVEIHKNRVIGSDPLRGLIPWSEIKPINLTAEILKKNGFSIMSPRKTVISSITPKETWVTSLIRQQMVICLV